jgi:hypothetical protein
MEVDLSDAPEGKKVELERGVLVEFTGGWPFAIAEALLCREMRGRSAGAAETDGDNAHDSHDAHSLPFSATRAWAAAPVYQARRKR